MYGFASRRIGVWPNVGSAYLPIAARAEAVSLRSMDATLENPAETQYADVVVRDVMHEGIIVCAPESPLRYAAGLMARHRVHAVVVWGDDEEGGAWGVLSDGDVLSAFGDGELDGSAGALARTPIITVSTDDGVLRAAELMRRHQVTHLVATERGRPVGVISTLDLARLAAAGIGII
jgi:CBS domain-containing protein